MPRSFKDLLGVEPRVLALLLAGGVVLSFAVWFEKLWFPIAVPAKGSIAPHTLRARFDTVYDLYETYKEEAAEAKLSYIPIYNKDNDLLFDYRSKVLAAALDEAPGFWQWPEEDSDGGVRDAGPADAEALDAGATAARDPDLRRATRAPPKLSRRAKRGARATVVSPDIGVPDARRATSEETDELDDDEAIAQMDARTRELRALVLGCFRLLIPFYKDGVVGDGEFPREKNTIRIFSGERYTEWPVSLLHRFSELHPMLKRSAAQFFFKTDEGLRDQVVDYVLERLPPNMNYARENESFIKDISQVTGVKMLLIRRGDILVRKGQMVDTRLHHAIKAAAAKELSGGRKGPGLSRVVLLLAVLLIFAVGSALAPSPQPWTFRTHLTNMGGLLIMAYAGSLTMAQLPVHAAILPQAALAMAFAVLLGRGPGVMVALLVPFVLSIVHVFDMSSLVVGVLGGVTGAFAVRKRQRSSVVAAGVLVGIAQALAFEAVRAVEGRPRTYFELWEAAEAFGGGGLAGACALFGLPFAERALGKSSRGKLRAIGDFDHPLIRQLHERAPGTFAHTMTLLNMVELAVDKVGADRLLARAGTLFHDVGKMLNPSYFTENQAHGQNVHDELSPTDSARAIIAHVQDGVQLARRARLPDEVIAFIQEHHGTAALTTLLAQAKAADATVDEAQFRYPGPKPCSLESAILMIADAVDAAARSLVAPDEKALEELVEHVALQKLTDGELDESGLTPAQFKAIRSAFVSYLVGALRRRTGRRPSREHVQILAAAAATPSASAAESEDGARGEASAPVSSKDT